MESSRERFSEIGFKESPSLEILKNNQRFLIFSEEITRSSAKNLTADLLRLDFENHEPITLFFSSQGGDVEAAFSVYDVINLLQSPVEIVGAGLVASAAILIFLSVPKEKRLSLKNATYMIHQPITDIEGRVPEIESRGKQLDYIRSRMDELISEKTGKSLEKVKKDTDEDTWFSAQEALKYGLVGSILSNFNSYIK